MSASRDQSQKVAFVYSNLYQIYQKGKSAAQNAEVSPETTPVPEAPVAVQRPVAQPSTPVVSKGAVLKAQDLHSEKPSAKVSSYNPAELIGKHLARPASLPRSQAAQQGAPKQVISGLKDNLKSLNDLHTRLRFMLQELEDLVKE